MFLEFHTLESLKLYLSPAQWFSAGDNFAPPTRHLGMSGDFFYCCNLEGERVLRASNG